MGFLRELFRDQREEVWQQFAEQIGAQYVDGGTWNGDKVQAHVGEWTITLDTYTVSTGKVFITFTRFRAPYVNADGFQFSISRADMFSGIGKMLGMQDVEIGEPTFDAEFVIKGNNEAKLRRLFANPQIRQLLLSLPEIQFEVKDDEGWFATEFPAGVDELYFSTGGIITDLAQLRSIYQLFSEVLNQLCVIGSAYKKDPQLQL